MRGHRALGAWLAGIALSGCSLLEERSEPKPPGPDEVPAPQPPPPIPPGTDPDDRGAVWYAMLCASCHGAMGEGAIGPALDRWTRSRAELVSIIDMRMPLGNPERCGGECPSAVADYVLEALQLPPPPASCEAIEVPERRLRLLTRREYENTVRDLLHVEAMPCATDAQCNLESESCVSGFCASDPCSTHTFSFNPGARAPQSVFVAGSFNNWTAGAWPMVWHAALGRWIAKHHLADGTHTYKFVIDGTEWIADPTNPQTMPDGFGGQNSVLTVDCRNQPAPGEIPENPAANFPIESRPTGYAFDNHCGAAIPTAVHVAEHMAAASALAGAAVSRLDQLLGCDPASPGCAETFVRSFGKRAFRRPLEQREVDKYRALILAESSFTEGVRIALQVMLASPSFLYRSELGDQSGRLTDWELASALSYTFWGTMPDQALFAAAERGNLDVEREARRLLADPRARELFGLFVVQWLGVEPILTTTKHTGLYPGFDEELRRAMLEETMRFAGHVAFDSTHAFGELLTSSDSLAGGRLAALYGSSGGARAGLLGHASVLATYAHSDQSSPIKRGVFVRERLLCEQFGTPPPDAGGLPEVDPNATTRERFAMHTAKESCRACHQYIDGVGFGFERFDAIGAYRELESGRPIDASGNMNDVEGFGTRTDAPFSTLPELANILASSERAKSCFATQYYRFAHGSSTGPADRCALQDIQRKFAGSGWDIRELMIAVVTSPAFLERR